MWAIGICVVLHLTGNAVAQLVLPDSQEFTTTSAAFVSYIDNKMTETDVITNGVTTDQVDFSTLPSENELSGSSVSSEEVLYLEFDHEFANREEFWSNNQFQCLNGSLQPSEYLSKKYGECKLIHKINPKCTRNCELASTMLLGETRTPTLELFEQYFKIVLPDAVANKAIEHFQMCFKKYGRTEDFLDSKCERPENFFLCTSEFKEFMVCE